VVVILAEVGCGQPAQLLSRLRPPTWVAFKTADLRGGEGGERFVALSAPSCVGGQAADLGGVPAPRGWWWSKLRAEWLRACRPVFELRSEERGAGDAGRAEWWVTPPKLGGC